MPERTRHMRLTHGTVRHTVPNHVYHISIPPSPLGDNPHPARTLHDTAQHSRAERAAQRGAAGHPVEPPPSRFPPNPGPEAEGRRTGGGGTRRRPRARARAEAAEEKKQKKTKKNKKQNKACPWQGSNLRPHPYEGCATTTELQRLNLKDSPRAFPQRATPDWRGTRPICIVNIFIQSR